MIGTGVVKGLTKRIQDQSRLSGRAGWNSLAGADALSIDREFPFQRNLNSSALTFYQDQALPDNPR